MSNNGAYDLTGVIWHQHSPRLMEAILKLWPDKSIPVVDLGCGMNYYCSVLEHAGYNAVGIDGCKLKGVDIVADITGEMIKPALRGFSGNVISLEVGEHLPPHLSNAYLDNVCSFGGDVLLSWAIPGQAGVGHINCQSNEWVIEQMESRGMKHVPEITAQLRETVVGCSCSWFKNTLMYFTR